MIILLIITTSIIFLYLLYPIWLIFITSNTSVRERENEEVNRVSVILLSYNGKKYLQEKINFLISELSGFHYYELIIIDDNSTDGSLEILHKFRTTNYIKIINNQTHSGIPFSMNLGVAIAKYEYLVFCDQRQELSNNILQRIVEPLKYENVGAVSGCISHVDKDNRCSYIRRHENFLKVKESKAGSLIGVYGPLYAIKKNCYSTIPDNIILDDLYLSLKILKSKKIELREDCQIVDDNFSILYDYQRARRYLSGLIQILKEKSIIHNLNSKQKIMLIWHKYFRLLIPSCLFLCYIGLGIAIPYGMEFIIAFCAGTLIGGLSVLPGNYIRRFRLKNLIRMNILYVMAFLDIFINDFILRRKTDFTQSHL